MTAKEEFTEWFEQEKKKGMIGMHVSPVIPISTNNNKPRPTEEQLYAELMRIIKAPDVPDHELLGKYSPL